MQLCDDIDHPAEEVDVLHAEGAEFGDAQAEPGLGENHRPHTRVRAVCPRLHLRDGQGDDFRLLLFGQ